MRVRLPLCARRPAGRTGHHSRRRAACPHAAMTRCVDVAPSVFSSAGQGAYTMRPYGAHVVYPFCAIFYLGQHRTIWQEHSAKDFASYESYKRAGILYVFPPFITARMGRKIGRRTQTQLCGDALVVFLVIHEELYLLWTKPVSVLWPILSPR